MYSRPEHALWVYHAVPSCSSGNAAEHCASVIIMHALNWGLQDTVIQWKAQLPRYHPLSIVTHEGPHQRIPNGGIDHVKVQGSKGCKNPPKQEAATNRIFQLHATQQSSCSKRKILKRVLERQSLGVYCRNNNIYGDQMLSFQNTCAWAAWAFMTGVSAEGCRSWAKGVAAPCCCSHADAAAAFTCTVRIPHLSMQRHMSCSHMQQDGSSTLAVLH